MYLKLALNASLHNEGRALQEGSAAAVACLLAPRAQTSLLPFSHSLIVDSINFGSDDNLACLVK
jgi:hypothetical protein